MNYVASGRAYTFGVALFFVVLFLTAWLPLLLAAASLVAGTWAGYRVVGGDWEVPGLSDWLRGDS